MAQLRITLFLFATLALGAGTCPSGGGDHKPQSKCADLSNTDCYNHPECLSGFDETTLGFFCTERLKDCDNYNTLSNISQMRAACKAAECEFTRGGTCTFEGIPGNPPKWQLAYQVFLTQGQAYPTDPAQDAKYIGLTDINKRLVPDSQKADLKKVDLAAIATEFKTKFTEAGTGKDQSFSYQNPQYPNTWAVLLYPAHDWNGAFKMDDLLRFRLMAMSVFHSVALARVESVDEIDKYLQTFPNQSIYYLVVGGHGASRGGDDNGGFIELGSKPEDRLTPSSVLSDQAIAKLHPLAIVTFDSCSVGSGEADPTKSVPTAFSKMVARPTIAGKYTLRSDNIVITNLFPYSEVFYGGLSSSFIIGLEYDERIFFAGPNVKEPQFSFNELFGWLMEDAVTPDMVDGRIKNTLALRRALIVQMSDEYSVVQDTSLLQSAPELRFMLLNGNIHNWKFENLAKLEKIEFRVYLRTNRQEERFVQFLQNTQSKKSLTELELLKTSQTYGDSTAKAISTNLLNLDTLALTGSAITEPGLRALASMPKIKTIDITSHGQMLPETVEQVRKDFPSVEIKD